MDQSDFPKLPDYRAFLSEFVAAGYQTERRSAAAPTPKGILYLRHDIDFDCGYARALAEVEVDMGLVATYYFMLSSPTYNAFSRENMGHTLFMRWATRSRYISILLHMTTYWQVSKLKRRCFRRHSGLRWML